MAHFLGEKGYKVTHHKYGQRKALVVKQRLFKRRDALLLPLCSKDGDRQKILFYERLAQLVEQLAYNE